MNMKRKYKRKTYEYAYKKFDDKKLLISEVEAKCMKCDDIYRGEFKFGICGNCKKTLAYTDMEHTNHRVMQ